MVRPSTSHAIEEEGLQHFDEADGGYSSPRHYAGQNQTNTKEVEVEDIANGHFDVLLKEMGVPTEDTAAY